MNYYTRSTIITPLTRIRRERLLPGGGEVIAKIGQEVAPTLIVARMAGKMNFEIVPVCKLLGITQEELSKRLLVRRGDAIKLGTPLVGKAGFGRKGFVSPVDGVLYAIVNGRLVFQQAAQYIELRALAKGRVVNRVANRGVVLEINGSQIQAVWDSGKEGFGVIHTTGATAVAPLTSAQLEDEVNNRILVTGIITQADVLKQAEQAGISGLIAGSIAAHLLPAARAADYPIFVTDGFGEQGMKPQIFQLMQQSEARDVALFKSPPNQSGIRPEIIIPLEAVPGEELLPAGRPLAVGQPVRIMRQPFDNQTGVVVNLRQRTQITPIGSRAYGADVELSDGQVVFTPFANLDAII